MHNIILCNYLILYYTILYCILFYYTILHYSALCTVSYYTILYYTKLCYIIRYRTILYYAILYYALIYSNVFPIITLHSTVFLCTPLHFVDHCILFCTYSAIFYFITLSCTHLNEIPHKSRTETLVQHSYTILISYSTCHWKYR